MSRDPDPTTRNDGKRLSKINLTENEWVGIKQLIKVLEPFASGTELLEGSKYATISFMNDAITVIKDGIFGTGLITPEDIDLTNPTTVFDDDIGIEDPDDDDEIEDYPKRRKIAINTPQNCNNLVENVKSALYIAMDHYWDVPQDEGMIATFLDPRCKSLSFATESQRNRTKTLLKKIYNEKRQDSGIIQQQKKSQSPVNSLLRNIFANRYHHERQNEIEEYMMIEETNMNTGGHPKNHIFQSYHS